MNDFRTLNTAYLHINKSMFLKEKRDIKSNTQFHFILLILHSTKFIIMDVRDKYVIRTQIDNLLKPHMNSKANFLEVFDDIHLQISNISCVWCIFDDEGLKNSRIKITMKSLEP